MFIGHFAVALATKKIDDRPSIGTYFMAAQFIDLLWPFFLITGFERVEVDPGNTAFTPLNFVSYPISHSLAGCLVWAILFSSVYYLFKKNGKGALLMGALVLSHWFLDFLTHRPDLPLSPWTDSMFGLGLWNQKILTIVIEVALFLAGCYLYAKATEPKKRLGKIVFYSFIIFMLAMYFINAYGPPPSSAADIPYVGFSLWILVAWGYWIDALHRSNVSTQGL